MSDFNQFVFYEVGVNRIDALRALWQKLAEHEARLRPRPADFRSRQTFEQRKRDLLARAQAGKVQIQFVATAEDPDPVACCIASIAPDDTGLIDSLFVDECYRGCGLGAELVRRATAWLDRNKAIARTVVVLHGNHAALALYARFGYHVDTLILRHSAD